MNVLPDGLSALAEHAWVTFVILLSILWGFFIMRGLLYRLFGDILTEFDTLSLSAAGWVLPVLFLSLFTFGLSLFFNAMIGGLFAAVVILISSFIFIRRRLDIPPSILFAFLLFLSIIFRFAFLKDLFLPSYFDSAEHYRLINAMTKSYQLGFLADELNSGFYHLGFHYLAAGISYFLHVDIAEFMLVFGQISLALLPFPLFFIIKRETDSLSAAFFTCLLAGFGYHMPAHLMNWGKYPALLSLVCISFVFSLAYMVYRDNSLRERKSIWILLSFAILASVLVHSRTIVLYGLMTIAAITTLGWKHLRIPYRLFGFGALLLLFMIELYTIDNNPVLKTLLDGYLKNDSRILILILLLTVISIVHYTEPTLFLLAWLALCMLCLFIPVTFPMLGVQTLLDRPFVQMFSYIPLSILGGLGFASSIRMTKRFFPDLNLIQRFVVFFAFGFVLLNAALHYNFYPSNCCRLVSRDDLAVFTWMENTLPPDANILIASTGLYVTPFETSQTPTGVDAGIWITPLLSRRIALAEQGILFDQVQVHMDLCGRSIGYIYIGGLPQSFNPLLLDSRPEWYLRSFALPSAKIYQVTGCG
ncbi:MAG: hypothetical protein HYU84_07425 [Chloroflexi bacterium]|nr:hypothetical protein [Chloroflexota bacterium]